MLEGVPPETPHEGVDELEGRRGAEGRLVLAPHGALQGEEGGDHHRQRKHRRVEVEVLVQVKREPFQTPENGGINDIYLWKL